MYSKSWQINPHKMGFRSLFQRLKLKNLILFSYYAKYIYEYMLLIYQSTVLLSYMLTKSYVSVFPKDSEKHRSSMIINSYIYLVIDIGSFTK